MPRFVEVYSTSDAYWRSIILFGRNSASYKFALGKALLEAAGQEKDFVPLEDLAEPYARNLVIETRGRNSSTVLPTLWVNHALPRLLPWTSAGGSRS